MIQIIPNIKIQNIKRLADLRDEEIYQGEYKIRQGPPVQFTMYFNPQEKECRFEPPLKNRLFESCVGEEVLRQRPKL